MFPVFYVLFQVVDRKWQRSGHKQPAQRLILLHAQVQYNPPYLMSGHLDIRTVYFFTVKPIVG